MIRIFFSERATPLLLTALLVAASAGSVGCEKRGEPGAADPSTASEAAESPGSDAPKTAENQAAEPGESQEKSSDVPGLEEATDAQNMLLVEAKKAFLTDDIPRAEALFKTLADTKPVSGPQVSAVIALAQIYIESDRPDEALKLYASLSDSVGDLPEIQLVVARAYADLGETTRAIEAYQKLLKVQPDFVFAHLEIGKLYAAAGRKEDAAQALYKYEQKIYKLSELLEAPDTPPGERVRVLNVFSLVSDDRATAATMKVLQAPTPAVREQAAVVLGQTGAIEAIDALKKMMIEDPDQAARMAAKGAVKELESLGIEGGAPVGPTFVEDKADLPLE